MFAVIKTGGKQYRVAADDTLQIARLEGEVGDQVTFGEVVMLGGDKPTIGVPLVSDASVVGEIVEHGRGRKIIIFKKRRRQNSRRRNGHRQDYTLVRITDILAAGEKAGPRRTARKAKPAATEASADAGAATDSGVKDDVALISGVGPKLKEKLAGAGINSLTQIAAWSDSEAEKVDTDLELRGRVLRDDWVGQATDLLAGKPPRAKVDQASKD
jgi:large subunit ribosomal protein L21